MNILFVASEAAPFAKSGGLGDVAGTLPKALKEAGNNIKVVLPEYKVIKDKYYNELNYIGNLEVSLGWRKQGCAVRHITKDGIDFYFIENNYYFHRDGLYGYDDDNERFAFFSKSAIELLNLIDFKADIIHCNDWQTGPVCLYLKDIYSKFSFYSKMKTVFTIHNLQYQGKFSRDSLNVLGIDDSYFTPDKIEYYGQVNYMKAGIVYADKVTTVSKTYSKEIKTYEYGYGLEGVLISRDSDLSGIVNGIDYEINNPVNSTKIYANFSADNFDGKVLNKYSLQKELGLPQRDVPVYGLISRLVDQKGVNIFIDSLNEMIKNDVQIVILGTGDFQYENTLKNFANWYGDKISANIRFDDTLAQKIYAGCDYFLMPSLFEPCGLGQLFAMSYGTVPIARATGGLVDTIKHYNSENKTGNGFLFNDFIPSGLIWAFYESLRFFYTEDRKIMFENAIKTKFSWQKSALEYISLYNSLL